jgi:hypothetical protein
MVENSTRQRKAEKIQKDLSNRQGYSIAEAAALLGKKLLDIPEKKEGKFTLIAKNETDVYFKKQGYGDAIMNFSEWLTFSEVQEKYGFTGNTGYSFISRNRIPKKQQDGKRYYSKFHIDTIKNKTQ